VLGDWSQLQEVGGYRLRVISVEVRAEAGAVAGEPPHCASPTSPLEGTPAGAGGVGDAGGGTARGGVNTNNTAGLAIPSMLSLRVAARVAVDMPAPSLPRVPHQSLPHVESEGSFWLTTQRRGLQTCLLGTSGDGLHVSLHAVACTAASDAEAAADGGGRWAAELDLMRITRGRQGEEGYGTIPLGGKNIPGAVVVGDHRVSVARRVGSMMEFGKGGASSDYALALLSVLIKVERVDGEEGEGGSDAMWDALLGGDSGSGSDGEPA